MTDRSWSRSPIRLGLNYCSETEIELRYRQTITIFWWMKFSPPSFRPLAAASWVGVSPTGHFNPLLFFHQNSTKCLTERMWKCHNWSFTTKDCQESLFISTIKFYFYLRTMKCLAGTTQANFLSDVSAGVWARRGCGLGHRRKNSEMGNDKFLCRPGIKTDLQKTMWHSSKGLEWLLGVYKLSYYPC